MLPHLEQRRRLPGMDDAPSRNRGVLRHKWQKIMRVFSCRRGPGRLAQLAGTLCMGQPSWSGARSSAMGSRVTTAPCWACWTRPANSHQNPGDDYSNRALARARWGTHQPGPLQPGSLRRACRPARDDRAGGVCRQCRGCPCPEDRVGCDTSALCQFGLRPYRSPAVIVGWCCARAEGGAEVRATGETIGIRGCRMRWPSLAHRFPRIRLRGAELDGRRRQTAVGARRDRRPARSKRGGPAAPTDGRFSLQFRRTGFGREKATTLGIGSVVASRVCLRSANILRK